MQIKLEMPVKSLVAINSKKEDALSSHENPFEVSQDLEITKVICKMQQ